MNLLRRLLRVLALSLCTCSSVAFAQAQTPPLRIMPLGDSLTTGTSSEGAYRNRLYSLLTTAGYNVDFIGTRTDSINPTLPDRDHQGMGGYRIDQIQSGLTSWLDAVEEPDVVLLLVGTNDFSQNSNTATAPARLSALIAEIATQRPFAKIIVSSLPPRTDSSQLEALQLQFNASIPGIVSDQVALGRRVTFVDMHQVLLPADLSEGVHPNLAGYEKMAAAWLPAITNVTSTVGGTEPPVIIRAEAATDLQHISLRFSKPLADSSVTLANFTVNGGVTVSQAVLDPLTKRTITLTTSSQIPGALYTVRVSGVRDRTLQQNQIVAGSTVLFPSFTLSNGGFEQGQASWTMTGNYLVFDTTPPYVASKGGKMVVMNGGQSPPSAVISQSFPTVPGQYYKLSYDVGILALNSGELKLAVDVNGSVALLSRVDSVFGNSRGDSVWAGKTAWFVADGPTTTLTFRDVSDSTDTRDLLLDNIRVAAAPVPINTAPVATAESYSTNQRTALVVAAPGVLANDSDAEGNSLTAVMDIPPAHGTLSLASNGGFTYTPAPGYIGADSFSYHATDGQSVSNTVVVPIAVNAIVPGLLVNGGFEGGQTGWNMSGNFLVYNTSLPYAASEGLKMVVLNGGQSAPNARISQTFSTLPGRSYVLDFSVGTLATNTASQTLGVSVAGATPLLSLAETVSGNGLANTVWTRKSHTFTADGTSATLTFLDLSSTSDGLDLLLDDVKLTLLPANIPPVAVADSYATNLDTPLVVPASGVLANDSGSGSLSAVLDDAPLHGSLVLDADGGFVYRPAASFTGTDSFTYHARNGSISSNVVTVEIAVQGWTSNVLLNGGFESDFAGWTAAGNQKIETYPARDGVKLVAFNGNNLTPNGVLSQTFPTIPGRTYTLAFDAGVFSYVQSQQKLDVRVTGAGNLLNQTVSFNAPGNGGFRWSSRSYTFVANSEATTLQFADLSTATIGLDLLLDKVRVDGPPVFPNNAPVAFGDSFSVNKDTALVVPTAGVLINDIDTLGRVVTAVADTSPAHGTLSLNATGGFFYQPDVGFTGTDSFSYHAQAGGLSSNTVVVTINVIGVSAGLLVNPSFESGFAGWTATGNQTIEYYPPTDGVKIADFNSQDLTPNATLSQSVATTPGQAYRLTFDAGVLAYVSDKQNLQVTVNGAKTLVSQTVSLVGTADGVTRWASQTFSFVADSTSTAVLFRDLSTSTVGIDLLLDNVRLVAVTSPGPDPQPPTVTPGNSAAGPVPDIRITSGAAIVGMIAPVSGTYIFQRSEDLKSWQEIGSMDCDAGERVEFQDAAGAQGAGIPRMFYRIGWRAAQ